MIKTKIHIIFIILLLFYYVPSSCAQQDTPIKKSIPLLDQFREVYDEIKKEKVDSKEKALLFGDQALLLGRQIGDSALVAKTYIRISAVYFHHQDYMNSVANLKRAEDLQEFLESNWVGLVHSRLGSNYLKLGNYPTAVNHMFVALNASREGVNIKSEASSAINLGSAFHKNKQNEKAIYYYDYAFEIFDEIHDTIGLMNCYNNKGVVYREEGDYEKALDSYFKSLDLARQIHDSLNMSITIGNIGALYLFQQNQEKAIELIKEALSLGKEAVGVSSFSSNQIALGSIYKDMKQYDLAIFYLLKAKELVEEKHLKDTQIECYLELSECYYAKKDYEKAYAYNILHSNLEKEVYNQKNLIQIENLEISYQLDHANEEREQLQQKNQIQKLKLEQSRIYLFALAFGIFLLVVIMILFFQRQRLISMKRTIELESKLFRSQMNPHFIFNSLSAIQSYVYAHEPREAAKYLSSFAKLTRSILTSSAKEFITLDDEIETLEHYLKLQQLRYDNRFQYQIQIDDEIEPSVFEIPPMLIQPFLENSIEHGFSDGLEVDGDIQIHYRLLNKQIEVELSDNGIGYKQSKANKKSLNSSHESMAISIIEERLRLFSSSFSRKKMITITDLGDENPDNHGTLVKMILPYRIR